MKVHVMKRTIIMSVLACLVALPAAAADIEVKQDKKKFDTKAVTASVGDDIVFKNNDKVAHNVHSSNNGHRFDLGLQRPGESARLNLSTPGEFMVRCAIHPKMKVKVSVK